MIFALRQPAVLLGLVLGYAAGCLLRVAASRLILTRGPGLSVVGRRSPLRGTAHPRAWLDPFGAVAVLLAGVGWSVRQEAIRARTARLWAVAAAAVAVHAALTAAGLAVFVALDGSRDLLHLTSLVSILHGSQPFVSTGQRIALGFAAVNLGSGLLSLVPIPPLETGVAAWTSLPRTVGARRLAYRLLDEQWGVAAVLLLVLLPLAGQQPALLALVGAVGDRILQAV